jgi:glucose-6-phosphate 1-dehydrogenase
MEISTLENPLEKTSDTNEALDPCILVIFGATGDLTARKLIPSLYQLALKGQLPTKFVCVGFARRDKDSEIFRKEMFDAIQTHSPSEPFDSSAWDSFSKQLFYHRSAFDHDQGYGSLSDFLLSLDKKFGTNGNRLYYLSTPPSHFPLITEKLHKHGLLYDSREVKKKWSRIIVEKPFGHDLASAISLEKHFLKYLHESQIYRIDHYLGKETVQNLMVFRFANSIFESLWNNKNIDHIQITVGEDIGIGTRGNFFEEAGLLRDVIQNHLMQLLTLVAMEPPVNLKADSIRDEKVKVLQAIRPIDMQTFHKKVIRGQYGPGTVNSESVKGYREEENVSPTSVTETFAALEIYIDNWRWAGVPFYLRAGKRLPKRATEIAITFNKVPSILFQQNVPSIDANVLIIRIQPDARISLKINCKVPGLSNKFQSVKMNFPYGSTFGSSSPDAYERLICDCITGDRTLFTRGDEVLASWSLLTPILNRWSENVPLDFPNYSSGAWGPHTADEMLEKVGRSWRTL